jgi:hypothetical protein
LPRASTIDKFDDDEARRHERSTGFIRECASKQGEMARVGVRARQTHATLPSFVPMQCAGNNTLILIINIILITNK